MDMSLWAFLAVAAVYATCRFAREQDAAYYSKAMSFIGGLMALTRPESLLLVPVMILLAAGVSYAFNHSVRQALRLAAAPFTVFATVTGTITLFRYFYFGYPFPNTYYAKVSPDYFYNLYMGLQYLNRFLHHSPLLLPILAVAGLVALRSAHEGTLGKNERTRHLALLSAVLSAFVLLLIPILNGGDHFVQGRFFAPAVLVLPLPCISLLPAGIDWPVGRQARRAVTIGWMGLIILVALLQISNADYSLEHEFTQATRGLQTGEILNRIFPGEAKPTVGVFPAGGIARTYNGYVIDVLGLNNTLVAHSGKGRYGIKNHASFSTKAFYRLSPDLFSVHLITPESLEGPELVDQTAYFDEITHQIRTEPEFQNSYERLDLWLRDPAIGSPSAKLTGSGSALDWLMRPRLEQPIALRMFMKRGVADRIDPRTVEVRRGAKSPN
jgi:arabinofuranosyltransferase